MQAITSDSAKRHGPFGSIPARTQPSLVFFTFFTFPFFLTFLFFRSHVRHESYQHDFTKQGSSSDHDRGYIKTLAAALSNRSHHNLKIRPLLKGIWLSVRSVSLLSLCLSPFLPSAHPSTQTLNHVCPPPSSSQPGLTPVSHNPLVSFGLAHPISSYHPFSSLLSSSNPSLLIMYVVGRYVPRNTTRKPNQPTNPPKRIRQQRRKNKVWRFLVPLPVVFPSPPGARVRSMSCKSVCLSACGARSAGCCVSYCWCLLWLCLCLCCWFMRVRSCGVGWLPCLGGQGVVWFGLWLVSCAVLLLVLLVCARGVVWVGMGHLGWGGRGWGLIWVFIFVKGGGKVSGGRDTGEVAAVAISPFVVVVVIVVLLTLEI